jgi:hypothetical protein
MVNMGWIALEDKKPNVSAFYKVKATGMYKKVKSAYYDVRNDAWVHDDGSWLPVDVRLYISHWQDK